MKYAIYLFVMTVGGLACTADPEVRQTGKSSGANPTAQDDIVIEQTETESSAAGMFAGLVNVSKDDVNASAESATQRIASLAPETTEGAQPVEFDQQVENIILSSFLEQQQSDPKSMSEEQAKTLAGKLNEIVKVARNKNPIATAKSMSELISVVSDIRIKNKKAAGLALNDESVALALYDNTTVLGRGLNGVNGLFDLVVELYAAVLNLDIQAVFRVATSAVRVITNLVSA